MEILETQAVGFVGYASLICPHCKEKIMINTLNIEDKNQDSCFHCKKSFKFKIIKE